jgi:hypothetical protein
MSTRKPGNTRNKEKKEALIKRGVASKSPVKPRRETHDPIPTCFATQWLSNFERVFV